MAGAVEGVYVDGLGDLLRACSASEKGVRKGVRGKLREAVEPVRAEAERLAPGGIRNLGPVWGRMRAGVTTSYAYVAPASRRSGGSPRPNLGPLLMKRAMEPALDAKAGEVERKLEEAIDDIANRNW